MPSITLSICIDQEQRGKISEASLEIAKRVLFATSKYVLERGLPANSPVVSINVPLVGPIEGVRLAELSMKGYGDIYVRKRNGFKAIFRGLRTYDDDTDGTGVYAIRKKFISIVPLNINLSSSPSNIEKIVLCVKRALEFGSS